MRFYALIEFFFFFKGEKLSFLFLFYRDFQLIMSALNVSSLLSS